MTRSIPAGVITLHKPDKARAIAAKLATLAPASVSTKPAKARKPTKAKAPKQPKLTARERFEKNVDRSGGPDACHNYLKPNQSNGYGRLSAGGECMDSHRAAWVFEHGTIPPGMCVLHGEICGTNKLCVNVKHLRLGSNAENSAQAKAAGRVACRKLTRDKAKDIAELLAVGARPLELAATFGVSTQSIINVKKGRTYWKATGIGPRHAAMVEKTARIGQLELQLGAAA